ncbi:hypothetical protein XENOCAPTIV_012218, partial [Xenoophorus captivus]
FSFSLMLVFLIQLVIAVLGFFYSNQVSPRKEMRMRMDFSCVQIFTSTEEYKFEFWNC